MADSKPPPPKLGFLENVGTSAFAACVAEAVSIPFDTAKVRLQVQAKGTGPPKYSGIFGTLRTVAADEGLAAFYKGIGAGLQRQVLFGGLRLGLYDPVKALFPTDKSGQTSFFTKVAAGVITSSAAICVASPTDLVKVRMQTEAKLPPGVPRRYPSAFRSYIVIARQEGVAALWTGLGPNLVRNVAISTTAIASYDQIKQTLIKSGLFGDTTPCYLASSVCAGFLSTACGSPFDVVKSRMMSAGPGVYAGVLDAFAKTLRNDGPLAFYNGFTTNWARLGSYNVVLFMTLEQIKGLVGAARAAKKQ